jgi:hypothetical protein
VNDDLPTLTPAPPHGLMGGMKQRWKLWSLALVLVLLLPVLVIVAAMLWPTPSDAQSAAARIKVGMDVYAACERLPFACGMDSDGGALQLRQMVAVLRWSYPDGSLLILDCEFIEWGVPGVILSIQTAPAPPVSPIIRVRRILARLIPSLNPDPPALYDPAGLRFG